jgi:hypothetical protein
VKNLPYPWGPPPRRLFGRCNICGRWTFFRRYRFCETCYMDAKSLAEDIFEEGTDRT